MNCNDKTTSQKKRSLIAKDTDRRTYTSRQHQDYLKLEEALSCEKFCIQDI
ncbi:hypothetical protein [Nostoc sp.]|uniref:hypothetical protein n=1 Tax=Nostoc sp. TaxID=1180 RepID=UPI002FF8245D